MTHDTITEPFGRVEADADADTMTEPVGGDVGMVVLLAVGQAEKRVAVASDSVTMTSWTIVEVIVVSSSPTIERKGQFYWQGSDFLYIGVAYHMRQ